MKKRKCTWVIKSRKILEARIVKIRNQTKNYLFLE